MAVIKINYTRRRDEAKVTLRYMVHRKAREGERTTRTLFSERGEVDKRFGYDLIDNAPRGSVFFRMIFTPDPKREDTYKDLPIQRLFEQTLRELSDRLGKPIEFLAVLHDDHTDIRHIHSLLVLRGKIKPSDIKAIRAFATKRAHLERQARDVVVTGRFAPSFRPRPRQRHSTGLTLPVSSARWYFHRTGRFRTQTAKTRPCQKCHYANERWRTKCQSCGYERVTEKAISFEL